MSVMSEIKEVMNSYGKFLWVFRRGNKAVTELPGGGMQYRMVGAHYYWVIYSQLCFRTHNVGIHFASCHAIHMTRSNFYLCCVARCSSQHFCELYLCLKRYMFFLIGHNFCRSIESVHTSVHTPFMEWNRCTRAPFTFIYLLTPQRAPPH